LAICAGGSLQKETDLSRMMPVVSQAIQVYQRPSSVLITLVTFLVVRVLPHEHFLSVINTSTDRISNPVSRLNGLLIKYQIESFS